MATVCMENTVWRARAEKPVRRLLSYCNTRERERERESGLDQGVDGRGDKTQL